jgi:tRNA/rRNA methyltransferase
MSPDLRIILVEPLYQGNVGSVARSMKNFGFRNLVLVNPCPLEGEAHAMASHAGDLLAGASIVPDLKTAIDNANLVAGTSGISGLKADEHLRIPACTPAGFRERFGGADGTIAVLFGRENNGLTRDELKQCDLILTIPTSEEYPVMNIAHAVTVVLYEMRNTDEPLIPIAERFDLELLYEHLDEMLEDIGHPDHKMEKTRLMLRRIFGRAVLTPREVQTLRGILRDIQRLKNK